MKYFFIGLAMSKATHFKEALIWAHSFKACLIVFAKENNSHYNLEYTNLKLGERLHHYQFYFRGRHLGKVFL